jgi:hypothetical protein
MRRRTTAIVLSLGLALTTSPVGLGTTPAPAASIAKTCSHGFVHAVIGGKQKCLHRGEFCSRRYASQYVTYGFHCRTGRLR